MCAADKKAAIVGRSCSIVWKGEMFLYGGHNNRQIATVNKCRLKQLKSKLDFDMESGTCAQRDNAEIFICFWNEVEGHKNCRRSHGPIEKFSPLPESNHFHLGSRIAVTSG